MPSRKKLSEKQKQEILKKQKRDWARKKRAKLSEEQLEERRKKDRERYKKKKDNGQIKSVGDLTPRMQKSVRKAWRERAQKSRQKKKALKETERNIMNETPPASPAVASSRSSRSRSVLGRLVADKNRRRTKAENDFLRQRVLLLENRLACYRMRLLRKKKRSNKISIDVPEEVISKKRQKLIDLKTSVVQFLETDDASRLTAGKKETITRHKQKKQIRLLNDSMLNLYKKFKEDTGIKISYALFCRNRPFWVVIPDARKRNTCLCSTHTNMDYLVSSLKKSNILNVSTSNELVKSVCCQGSLQIKCLLRDCQLCKSKTITFNEFNNTEKISCERWITKKTPIVVNKVTKLCQRTIKETFITTKGLLVKNLEAKFPAFMKHLATIINQYKAVNKIKKSLAENEALLHIDFAENYQCKYSEEVQSAHFGASKPQISLHTSVLYLHDKIEGCIQSFCSISKNSRHDPVLICVHLKPVIDFIKTKVPNIKTIHFQSDGPTTQYKNKSMFFLIAKYIGKELGIDNIIWHFSESGHGKGAPDGIGACVKRTADASVAAGRDVSDFDALISCLKKNCKGIQILPIDDSLVMEISEILATSTTPTFKGTLAIRKLIWSITNPDVIHAYNLSCLLCELGQTQTCCHNKLGIIFLFYKSNKDPVEPQPHCSKINPTQEESSNINLSKSSLSSSASVGEGARGGGLKGAGFFRACYGDESDSDDDQIFKISRYGRKSKNCSPSLMHEGANESDKEPSAMQDFNLSSSSDERIF